MDNQGILNSHFMKGKHDPVKPHLYLSLDGKTLFLKGQTKSFPFSQKYFVLIKIQKAKTDARADIYELMEPDENC